MTSSSRQTHLYYYRFNIVIASSYVELDVDGCSIRDITAEVAAAVLRAAIGEGLAEGHGDVGAKELEHMSEVRAHSFFFNTSIVQ